MKVTILTTDNSKYIGTLVGSDGKQLCILDAVMLKDNCISSHSRVNIPIDSIQAAATH